MTVIPKSLELLLRIHTHFPQTDILFKVGGAKALRYPVYAWDAPRPALHTCLGPTQRAPDLRRD